MSFIPTTIDPRVLDGTYSFGVMSGEVTPPSTPRPQNATIDCDTTPRAKRTSETHDEMEGVLSISHYGKLHGEERAKYVAEVMKEGASKQVLIVDRRRTHHKKVGLFSVSRPLDDTEKVGERWMPLGTPDRSHFTDPYTSRLTARHQIDTQAPVGRDFVYTVPQQAGNASQTRDNVAHQDVNIFNTANDYNANAYGSASGFRAVQHRYRSQAYDNTQQIQGGFAGFGHGSVYSLGYN